MQVSSGDGLRRTTNWDLSTQKTKHRTPRPRILFLFFDSTCSCSVDACVFGRASSHFNLEVSFRAFEAWLAVVVRSMWDVFLVKGTTFGWEVGVDSRGNLQQQILFAALSLTGHRRK